MAYIVAATFYIDAGADEDTRSSPENLRDEWSAKHGEGEAMKAYGALLERDDLYTASWGPVVGSTEWYNADDGEEAQP